MDIRFSYSTTVLLLFLLNYLKDLNLRFRFEKRIYIPLPETNERAGIFKVHLGSGTPHTIKEDEWMQLAEKAEK